jgi:hypothetical protein
LRARITLILHDKSQSAALVALEQILLILPVMNASISQNYTVNPEFYQSKTHHVMESIQISIAALSEAKSLAPSQTHDRFCFETDE